MDFQITETYGLFSLTTSFIYGFQNDLIIEIIIVKDSILVRKYILKIKF